MNRFRISVIFLSGVLGLSSCFAMDNKKDNCISLGLDDGSAFTTPHPKIFGLDDPRSVGQLKKLGSKEKKAQPLRCYGIRPVNLFDETHQTPKQKFSNAVIRCTFSLGNDEYGEEYYQYALACLKSEQAASCVSWLCTVMDDSLRISESAPDSTDFTYVVKLWLYVLQHEQPFLALLRNKVDEITQKLLDEDCLVFCDDEVLDSLRAVYAGRARRHSKQQTEREAEVFLLQWKGLQRESNYPFQFNR